MKIYVNLLSIDTVAQLEKKVFSQASGLFKSLFKSRNNESAASINAVTTTRCSCSR
jgi:hypothetical protein